MEMNSQEEQHIHLEQCADDLNEAWRLGRQLQASEGNPLAGAAFKYLLIAYSRPFKESRGPVSRRLKLDESVVPEAHFELHRRLLAARDQVVAHSDLAPREPQLSVAQGTERRIAVIVQNVVHGTEEFQNLAQVIALIEAVLGRLYENVRSSEQALPVTIRPQRHAV